MNSKSHFASALVWALYLGLAIGPALAEGAAGSEVRVAQSSDYLPPPGQRSAPPSDYDAPQQISPRRGGSGGGYNNSGGYNNGGYGNGGYGGGNSGRPLPPPPYQGQGQSDVDPDADYERDASARDDRPYGPRRDHAGPPAYEDRSYSSNEIIDAGHGFFGGVSKGLAEVVEYAFRQQGRPNGYILGEEAGGAIVAGLRYGNGRLYTKGLGTHSVYWQGPSFGYDFGAEGSKTLILVYNLADAGQIYNRFAGVDGSAYFVGGVGVTFQTFDDVVLAPIRSGVGLRLGANVGYLKYTRSPTWNPF